MAKKVQLQSNPKKWEVVDGVEVLVDQEIHDLDPMTDSSCVKIEGHRTLEETLNQNNMFTPEITETKVMTEVGGVYHDNVVDGAYEEAILYGNTQVNLVESVTTDTKYIPHSFTSFQGNESKIGNYHNGRTNQVAPLVKGVTMVNLCQETSLTIQYQHTRVVANHNAKPNTKYTLKCKFTEKNKNAGIMIQSYGYKDGTWGYMEISKTIQNLGDDVLLTFTTHEQADSIIIYNNPAFCEDENDSITLDDIMVIEGDVTDLDLPFFKGMRSVELSRPLTNLFTDDLVHYNANTSSTNINGNITVTSTSVSSWNGTDYYLKNLKPHTKYIVMWDSLTTTQTSTTQQDILICAVCIVGNSRLGGINEDAKCPTLRSIIFDTRDKPLNEIAIRIHASMSNSEATSTTVKGLRVFEWDDSLRTLDLQTIGYFSGTKYVSARALETEGKNLYPYGDVNFTNDYVGWCDAKGNSYMYIDIAQKSKTRFLLKKGTYILKGVNATNVEAWGITDDKNTKVIYSGQSFTINQDTYFSPIIKTIEANVATTITNIQIERGETATSYEAYQSRYYKPRETEEIILRSLPNGVCDTFNLQTGELVQRISEIVLDGVTGVQDWQLDGTNETTGISGFYLRNSTTTYNFSIQKNKQYVISDKFKTISFEKWKNRDMEACIDNTGNIAFLISNSKLSKINGDGFKQYLQQNPITVQYALAEPIITKLQTYDRIYSGQTNAPTSMGNNLSALTYYSNNYYLKVGNLSPVPAILEPITSIPYDVRLKPSTLYTVKYNRGGNSNSMKFDLGGSVVEKTNVTDLGIIAEEFTVRTPAILSHEQLILSGTGYAHNFIIVEGDITGTELPYFEGMKDVKMPIVKNISRNLLNESSMRVFYESITLRTYDVFPCKPNTRYCFVSVGGESACNWHVCKKDARYERPENESVGIIKYLGYSKEIVTPQDCYYMCIHTGSNPTTDREVYNIKTAIYEGSFAECVNYGYEDYKENSVYAVQGEYPITSEMFEQGGFSASLASTYEDTKYDSAARLRSKDLIPVKPNTTYAFAHSFSKFAYNVYQWNGNKKFIDGVSQYFNSGQVETITTTADTQYIHFLMSKHDASQNITVAEYDWSQFHMYELDSTINLRSLPNGVKDELNLLTGEYIQRVGEVVLDNTETWNMDTTENATQPNTNIFYTGVHSDFKPLATVDRAGSLVCDKVNVVPDLYFVDKVGIMSNTDPRIYVRVLKTDAPDVATFTTYIQNNPLTLQYELAEPIISHVRLVSNNQEREVGVKLPNGVCNTYNPSTGMTTVRVGTMVLDGSENWKKDELQFYTLKNECASSVKAVNSGEVVIPNTQNFNILTGSYYQFLIVHDKLPSSDITTVNQWKEYLSQNPTQVWYELQYPQIQPDIVLPNGVHDEYNPETGVYTKRVGFIEFDGSADEVWAIKGADTENYRGFFVLLTNITPQPLPNSSTINNNFNTINDEIWLNLDREGCYIGGSAVGVIIAKSKLTTQDIDGLRLYLSQNPLKVWYELQTPITYQLTPYFGLPQPYAYEDGYLIHDSAYIETTLPPEFKYKLVANRTGQIVQNGRKLQEHTTRLSNLEALIIEATIESLFNRELQLFELELMDIQLIDLGE